MNSTGESLCPRFSSKDIGTDMSCFFRFACVAAADTLAQGVAKARMVMQINRNVCVLFCMIEKLSAFSRFS